MKAVTPEDTVVGHVQVQSHSVLLGGHHLAVVPLHQVDASDLMPVGEQQVRAFPCMRSKEYFKCKCELAASVWVTLQLQNSNNAKQFRKMAESGSIHY